MWLKPALDARVDFPSPEPESSTRLALFVCFMLPATLDLKHFRAFFMQPCVISATEADTYAKLYAHTQGSHFTPF